MLPGAINALRPSLPRSRHLQRNDLPAAHLYRDAGCVADPTHHCCSESQDERGDRDEQALERNACNEPGRDLQVASTLNCNERSKFLKSPLHSYSLMTDRHA
jgi:hypothetical protein